MGAVALLLVVVVACVAVLAYNQFLDPRVLSRIIIEAGAEMPAAQRFVQNDRFHSQYASDVSAIDTAVPGDYAVRIDVEDKEYGVTLEVSDTTAPTGKPVSNVTWLDAPLAADLFVTDVVDVTSVQTAFKTPPDFARAGDQDVTVVLTDTSGNASEVLALLTVKKDEEKPVIVGVADLSVFLGDTVSYRTGVTVTDNRDTTVALEIDNSAVDLTKPGTYVVVYSATDKAGNRAEATANIVITVKPDGYVSEAELNALIDQIFVDILKPDMTDLDRMSAIFYYIAGHIDYTGTSDKSDWIKGAYLGITRGTGDCYNYFALAKAMLNRAGYETIKIERVPAKTRHYWNLVKYNGEWYHFDPLPNLKYYHYVCLLRTDAEVEAYSTNVQKLFYTFDHTGIPPTATVPLEFERKVVNG
jgi:hypothetical protein